MEKDFLGNRAQISVELIIVLAAVVGLVLLLISQLQQTSRDGADAVQEKSAEVFKAIEDF